MASSPQVETASPQNDDWVKVQDDLMAKWASQLQILASLGLVNSESYVKVLEEEGGDLTKVVNRIIRHEAE